MSFWQKKVMLQGFYYETLPYIRLWEMAQVMGITPSSDLLQGLWDLTQVLVRLLQTGICGNQPN